jgi:hypothetical protein
MALEAPTNCWTTADKAIAVALATTEAFLAILDRVRIPEADAAKRVFGSQVGVPLDGDAYKVEELQRLGAFAQVFHDEAPYGKRRMQGGNFHPYGSTIVVVQMRLDDADAAVENIRGVDGSADAPTELEWFFQQRIGDLIDDLIEAFRDEEQLFLTACDVTQPPGFNNRKSQDANGKWIGCELTLTWGMGGG